MTALDELIAGFDGGDGLADLLTRAEVIVTCGPGGVGKTTTAAALGVSAAAAGRRALVVTVDPARRLADALGASGLGNHPTRVTAPAGRDWPGELWAVMLDTESTFDHLVRSQAPDPAQAEAILGSPLYRNIAGAMSGTQEYMAIEKLHELHSSGHYDLVVVDTPPSRNALDLLDAPRRLVRFLEHPIYRAVTAPSRTMARAVGVASRTFLWTIKRLAGPQVVQDVLEFFRAFDGMEEGFKRRADEVGRLLRARATGFVLVSSPRAEALEEAAFLGGELREQGFPLAGLVVNLVHPSPPPLTDPPVGPPGSALADQLAAHAELVELAGAERTEAEALATALGHVPVVEVPMLATDVHDVAGLTRLAAFLAPGCEGTRAAR